MIAIALSTTEDRQAQLREFLAAHEWDKATLHPLQADASFRRYIRVRARGRSAILMDAPPEREQVGAYVRVARYLHSAGYSTPEIFGADESQGFVLAEDLGDDLFSRVLAQVDDAKADSLYDVAVDMLAAWYKDAKLTKAQGDLPLHDYNEAEYLREVALFAEWYLPAVFAESQAKQLHEEYMELWKQALRAAALKPTHFVHRDFHADNLIWLPGRAGHSRTGLLDFQDALWGHPAYDMVSLLEDARCDVPHPLAERCIRRYLAVTGQSQEAFGDAYALLGAQRNSKIIGIFVRLSRRDGKHAYLGHLPRVWRYLERDLQHPSLAELRLWLDKTISPEARRALLTHG